MTTGYRQIADYALIGNTHSAALVSCDGSIDWCCLPHFDSGAVFCRLLDAMKGGHFRVGPVAAHESRRRYVDDTAILATDFTTRSGRARLIDFMHSQRIAKSRLGVDDSDCHRLLRCIEGVAGSVDLELVMRPTFDFARRPAALALLDDGALASSQSELLRLRVTPALPLRVEGDAVVARFSVDAGERVWIVLAHAGAGDEGALAPADPERLLDETYRHWREWDEQCTYEGPYHPLVRQSARVLKMLTFAPTGALIAAPTTSLPEELGGVRNWDYRYCWLRDAALVLNALMSVGHHEAANDFFHWLETICDCDELQILYRVDGGRELPERELIHLDGYRGSAPVRTGNGAASQTQLDAYGYILDAAFVCMERMHPIRHGLWRVLARLANEAAGRWREMDHGIWEVRGRSKHFLSSKLLCWVALDRAIRLARREDEDLRRWRQERERIREAILIDGFDRAQGAFTQAFGSSDLDASALLMPLVGFLPALDPRMTSTIAAIGERLTDRGLVYRYLNEDGLAGGEATFAICTFWLADNLALQGRVDEARELFEHVTSFANDVGLLSEQIDPRSGALLGNFPQGYTHLALVESALAIANAERVRRSRSAADRRDSAG